jgi:TolB-like protein/Tfp pilus assembly protein PilF
MSESPERMRSVRFGTFEVDLHARELRKGGLRLRLQEKPFQILELLLERSGEVVTRKDLREKLWPDSFVGFDRSLNTAMNNLRQVLGDSATNPRFVETRARQGYRFIAPVEVRRHGSPHVPTAHEGIHSIGVMPFRNLTGDAEMEYLSDGITESLINSLSQVPGIRVMARCTMFRYKGRATDPQSVGRDLGARALLVGEVTRRTNALVIGTELVEVENGWRLWGEQYSRKLADLQAVEQEISREITEKLRLRLTQEDKKRLARRPTASPEAYQDYLKGRFYWNKTTEESLRKAIVYFEQAIEKDPSYALAYTGLSDAYCLFGFFNLVSPREVLPKAKQAAIKALEIDDGLAEAHASLAGIMKSYDWDWQGAEREYRRALELNPNYAEAHRWYADFLSATGRPQEALRENRKAQELDPLSLVISMEGAWNLYMARDYQAAEQQALKTLEMEPNFAPATFALALAYEQMGKRKEAIAAFKRTRSSSGSNPATLAGLGHALGGTGRETGPRAILKELHAISKRCYVSPYCFALVHAGLREQDRAFEWLEKAVEDHDVWLVWLKTEPRFDNLRSDLRFQDLLGRVGLPA